MPSNLTIPPGFELMPAFGPLHETVGPIYIKAADKGWIAGMRIEQRHHNAGPMMHGGMMAFFVDTAFTYACKWAGDPPLKVVTTNLSIDFAGSASAGDWIEAHVDLMRVGKRVAFVNCFVFKGEQRIARANASFQVLGSS
jgi:uncharacterized protein (TIGR00369 family)